MRPLLFLLTRLPGSALPLAPGFSVRRRPFPFRLASPNPEKRRANSLLTGPASSPLCQQRLAITPAQRA